MCLKKDVDELRREDGQPREGPQALSHGHQFRELDCIRQVSWWSARVQGPLCGRTKRLALLGSLGPNPELWEQM